MAFLENFSRKESEAYAKGYRIDKDGNVASMRGLLKKTTNSSGYYAFSYKNSEGKVQHVNYHKFQAYHKYGDKIYESGMCVRHLDGNPLNNSWDNIEIGTQQENMMDIPREERVKHAIKATKGMIRWDYKKIRAMHDSGMSYREIMAETGITSKGTLSYIINERYINKDDIT